MPRQCSMTWIERRVDSVRRQFFLRFRLMKPPFVRRDECGAKNSLHRIDPAGRRILCPQAQADTNHQKQVAEGVAKCVQLSADFGGEILGPRDLPVASVENAVELKNCATGHKSEIIAAHQKKKRDNQQWKDRHRPRVRRDGKAKQSARDQTRDRPIQKTGDESVLRFAAVMEKPALPASDVTIIANVSPGFALLGVDIRAGSFKSMPKFFP